MSRSATIREVASRAQVSIGTVSNFLNNTKRIDPGTAERIQDAIRELRFIPNSAVRVVRGARSHSIGLLVTDPANPYYAELARGIEDVTFSAGLMLMSCNTKGESKREEHYAQELAEMRILGVIATAASDEAYLGRLRDSGAAVVVLGSNEMHAEFSAVNVNDYSGGFAAMEHLIGLGHTRMVLVGGPAADEQIRERFAGALAAVTAAGLDLAAIRRVDSASGSTADRMATAEAILALRPRPTAAFCANDQIALAVEAALMRSGVLIPEEFAIVGYDDIDAAALAPIPLTTMRQPSYEIGHRAAEIVLALAAGGDKPENVTFTPRLIVRDTAP